MENQTNTISSPIKLNNGVQMPRVGLGTYGIPKIDNIIYESIKDGVRSFDTASVYGNEKEVGAGINKAIEEGIVKREELFVVTKLWIDEKHCPEEAIKRQLKTLNLSYVDLYLDHWPYSAYKTKNGEAKHTPAHVLWKSMESLVTKGYTKSIGVSNYNVQSLMDLLGYAEIKPVVNQIEIHPYLTQENLVKFCDDNDVKIMAYNSMCKGLYAKKYHSDKQYNLLEEEVTKTMAEKYKTTPGAIALNWALSQDMIVIPSTSNPRRMKENLTSLNFKLTNDDLQEINKLNINYRFNPPTQYEFFGGIDIFA